MSGKKNMIVDDEDLFLDNIGPLAAAAAAAAASKRKATPRVKPKIGSAKTKAKFEITKSSSPDCAACVLCYGGLEGLRQCRSCFLKVCASCRESIAGIGKSFGQSDEWLCRDCSDGGGGLHVLLTAPAQKRSKVTKTGKRGTKRSFKKRSFRKWNIWTPSYHIFVFRITVKIHVWVW